MKILGIGVDIIENKRIKKSIKNHKFKKEFIVQKNSTINLIKNKLDIFLKDLLLKKLLLKLWALVLDIILNFKDIEIINDKLGKPYYSKTKKITKIVKKDLKLKI